MFNKTFLFFCFFILNLNFVSAKEIKHKYQYIQSKESKSKSPTLKEISFKTKIEKIKEYDKKFNKFIEKNI